MCTQECWFSLYWRWFALRTGVGLAIAKWTVEANGGRLELKSEVGSGSCFRIWLRSPWHQNKGELS